MTHFYSQENSEKISKEKEEAWNVKEKKHLDNLRAARDRVTSLQLALKAKEEEDKVKQDRVASLQMALKIKEDEQRRNAQQSDD